MNRVYCRSNYSPRRAVLHILRILLYIAFALLFAYTVWGAKLAEDTTAELAREQLYTTQLEMRLQDLEKENRLLRQDVAILYNINNLGDYCLPSEE